MLNVRTYIGSIDPATGRPTVTITNTTESSQPSELRDFLDDLAHISPSRRHRPSHPDVERNARLERRKQQLLGSVAGACRPDTARPLPHTVIHSPNGFAWGYAGNGPADLAHAILHRELAQPVPPDVYLPFREAVIARLPAGRFELPASQVWDWIRENRSLVEHHLFEAHDTAATPPTVTPTPRARGGMSL